jgi:hypothetical protein
MFLRHPPLQKPHSKTSGGDQGEYRQRYGAAVKENGEEVDAADKKGE